MSDPVTNVEIEDVLSSIRRLVSNGGKQERPTSNDAIKEVDKLVLTPSLRVDEGDENQHTDNNSDAELEPEGDARHYESQVDDRMKAGAHRMADGEDEFDFIEAPETDLELDGDSSESGLDKSGVLWDEDDQDLSNDSYDVENVDTPLEEPQFKSERGRSDTIRPERERSNLGARVAEFEEFVAARDDQWEPDGVSDDAYAGGSVAPLPWNVQVSDDEDEMSDNVKSDGQDAKADAEDNTEESVDANQDLAGETFETKNPKLVFEHLETDEAESSEAIQATNDVDDEDNLSEEPNLVADDALLDEDALRDMVSEIVRQELQGSLGERITRNVRKLVRREIHRALASQELD